MPLAGVHILVSMLDADEGDASGDGTAIVDLDGRLTGLRFLDREERKDRLELTLRNEDLQLFEDPIFEKGQKLLVSWGYPGHMTPPRRFIVKKSEGTEPVKVICNCVTDLLDRVKGNRREENATDSEFVRMIAQEYGYDGELLHVQDTRPDGTPLARRDSITQRETDARMLARLAKRNGFIFYIDATGLHWHERQVNSVPRKRYHWRNDPLQGDILEMPHIEVNLSRDVAKVKVLARDPITLEPVSATGSADDTEFTSLGKEDPVGDPDVDVNSQGVREFRLARGTTRFAGLMSAAAAQDSADARYRMTAQGRYKLTMRVKGDPGLMAKSIIDIAGIGPTFGGLYYVKSVETNITESGYIQSVEGRKDAQSEVKAAKKRALGKRKEKPEATQTPQDQLEWQVVVGVNLYGEREAQWIAWDPQNGEPIAVDRQTIDPGLENLQDWEIQLLGEAGQSIPPDV